MVSGSSAHCSRELQVREVCPPPHTPLRHPLHTPLHTPPPQAHHARHVVGVISHVFARDEDGQLVG